MTLINNTDVRLDRRRWVRRERLKRGRISAPKGIFSVQCVIVNMSVDGAKVRVDQQLHMPARVRLIDPLERATYAADLIWSQPPEYGLKFTGKKKI